MLIKLMKTGCKIFLLSCFLYLSGCSVPEFDPPSPPDAPPVFGETVSGTATWYGSVFHGRKTDRGELFDMEKLSASHESLPFGTIVEVTNPENGKSVKVVINDRHNLRNGTQLCVSKKAAQLLDTYPTKTFAVNYMVIE